MSPVVPEIRGIKKADAIDQSIKVKVSGQVELKEPDDE